MKGVQEIYIAAWLIIVVMLCACGGEKREEKAGPEIPVMETGSEKPMPDVWIDADTRHRIVRLSRRPGGGRSFYFHNNPFVPQLLNEGDEMIFYGPVDSLRQLFSVNLETLQIVQLTDHPTEIGGEIVAPTGRKVYYQAGDSVFATSIDTKGTELVFVFPEDFKATVTTLNADETLLAGAYAPEEKRDIYRRNPEKKDYFTLIYEARLPHTLFTVDLATKELKKLYTEKAWLNHVQFSPTDPHLLMYSHEGPWHLVDRIRTIDVNTGDTTLRHKRTVHREIAGHEFFSRDGRKIWYDLQIPRGETFYLAARDIETGDLTSYRMKRDEWSIHFNISPDQTLFAGDGGDSTQVAHAADGRWLYLFEPSGDSLVSEKLVNMKHHGYRPLEPNVHFSPDGKWIIFRSDLGGETNVYSVSVERENRE